MAPLRSGALIATLRCDAPACCGAFADEQRIVAGDERVFRRRAWASLVVSFAAGVAVWDVGGHHGKHSIALRPRVARYSGKWAPSNFCRIVLHETQVRKRRWRCTVELPGGSSLPSVATRPRIAARSPTSGASWWPTQARGCGRGGFRPSLTS